MIRHQIDRRYIAKVETNFARPAQAISRRAAGEKAYREFTSIAVHDRQQSPRQKNATGFMQNSYAVFGKQNIKEHHVICPIAVRQVR